jgi:hypothetical protein
VAILATIRGQGPRYNVSLKQVDFVLLGLPGKVGLTTQDP